MVGLRFAVACTGVEDSTATTSPRRFGGTPHVDRPGLLVTCSLTSPLNCTSLFWRVVLSVVSAETGGVKRSGLRRLLYRLANFLSDPFPVCVLVHPSGYALWISVGGKVDDHVVGYVVRSVS